MVAVTLHLDDFDRRTRLIRFQAIGTAVAWAESPRHQNRFFTSSLGGQELALLLRSGYQPRTVVVGCSVCRVGRPPIRQWPRLVAGATEMAGFTNVLYAARESALSSLQASAHEAKADGVVGITLTERPRLWGSHIMELLAVGTAIARVGPRTPIEPQLVLDLTS